MVESVKIKEWEKMDIVIDDIIFLKTEEGTTPVDPKQPIVIDDIIFLHMQEGNHISFAAADIQKSGDEVTFKVDRGNFTGTLDPNKLLVFDPMDCFVELGANSIVVRKWITDNGIRRTQLERYDLSSLDKLVVSRDTISGRLVINISLT